MQSLQNSRDSLSALARTREAFGTRGDARRKRPRVGRRERPGHQSRNASAPRRYLSRSQAPQGSRDHMSALELETDDLARCNEPDQPDDVQKSDAANDGRGETASASQKWRGCKEHELVGRVGAGQGERQAKCQDKRRPALRQRAKNGHRNRGRGKGGKADRKTPEHRIALDGVVQRPKADALVDQPGAGDDQKRATQRQHRRGNYGEGRKRRRAGERKACKRAGNREQCETEQRGMTRLDRCKPPAIGRGGWQAKGHGSFLAASSNTILRDGTGRSADPSSMPVPGMPT